VKLPQPDRKVPLSTNAPLGNLDPHAFLESFDTGRVSKLPDGRTLREYDLVALDRTLEVAHGIFFPAWTLNGSVPGPTLRATEGDLVRIHFRNEGSMPHTLHFHGFHSANMDGVLEVIDPGGRYTYEFEADPFGLHLYHCHVMPIRTHIARGLFGTFIVDPKNPRAPMREMVMVMNGYDTDLDRENELYSVNGVANCYAERPIQLRLGEPVRVYLVNVTENDPINSMHIHANFFQVYRTGTSLTPSEFTDTIMLCQGERAILEFTYRHPGRFMFHAHQSEFAELGWMGFFQVGSGPA
jgi:FtsP/CotA-like multicopper oxidase with cupredoxin domain